MIDWKIFSEQYVSGLKGKLNGIIVFEVFYDGMTSKHQSEKFKLNCFLTGFKKSLGHFDSAESAKEFAEKVFNNWLDKLGLQVKL